MTLRCITVFVIGILAGCTNDHLLVDQFDQVKTKANPFFASSCHDMEAWMISEKSALVYNGNYAIYTEDGFETFYHKEYHDLNPCGNGYLKTLFFDGDNYRVFDGYVVYYKDQSSIIQSFDMKKLKHDPALEKFDSYSTPAFQTAESFFFVRKLHFQDQVFVNLYQGDMSSMNTIFQSTIYSVGSAENAFSYIGLFETDDHLVYAEQEYVSSGDSIYVNVHATADGLNWTSSRVTGMPAKVFHEMPVNSYQNKVEGQKTTLVFGNSSLGFFISRDEAKTWSKIDFGIQETVISVEVVDEQTIYGLVKKDIEPGAGTVSQLLISTDAGMTWQTNLTQFYGDEISFFDIKNGIATSKQILQIPDDGGVTWKAVFMGSNQ